MDIERIKAVGFGVAGPGQSFSKIEFTRHPVGDDEIMIDIIAVGICHSDLHTIREHWDGCKFPMIPGHEIVGKCVKKGKNVDDIEIGDYIGVGCMVDSCGDCCACNNNREQECKKVVLTYNAQDWRHDDEVTQGGYSTCYVLNKRFAIKVKCDEKDLLKIPSLMCAGITTFSPIRQAKVEEGSFAFVAGLGGLGHMAAKYLHSTGCRVIAFDKYDHEKLAKECGVDFALLNDDGTIDESYFKKFEFGIITIPYKYNLETYMLLLHCGGKLAIVGLPPYNECPDINIKDMILKYPGVMIFGSLIGGIAETQLCVDFSIKERIFPEVVEIDPTPEAINAAYAKMENGDIEGRFVMDMRNINGKKEESKEESNKEEDKNKEENKDQEVEKHQLGGPIGVIKAKPIVPLMYDYDSFLLALKDRGYEVDNGMYDYKAFFDDKDALAQYLSEDAKAWEEAKKTGKYMPPHMSGDYKTEYHITWPGPDGKAWQEREDGSWVYTPPKDHKKKDGTQYTAEDYIKYFLSDAEGPNDYLNIDGKLYQGGSQK